MGEVQNVFAHGPFGGLTGSAARSQRSRGAERGRSAPLTRGMRVIGMFETAAIVSTMLGQAHDSKKNCILALVSRPCGSL